MTRDETIKILMVVQAAYPNYNPQDKTITVNLWSEMLEEFSYQQVNAALKAYIRTDKSGFAPSIGDVVDKVQTIFGAESENDAEAWNLVWKAIKSSGEFERAKRNFENLPEIIQKSIGSPGQLMEWALTQNLNIEVVSSNFKRTYRTELQRKQEIQKLSPDVLKLMNSLNNPQIEEKAEAPSISEERSKAIEKATRMPDRAKKRLDEIFHMQID